MDPLTGLQAGAFHITLHSILDQITEAITAIPVVITTDKVTTETTIETEHTNKTTDMTKEIKATGTGMTTISIEIDSTTGDDQINTNTTETSQRHRPHSNTQIETY